MGKVTIDTTWLSGIEDMPMSARIQFYGSLMALVLDGVEVAPKDKQASFAWKCMMPVVKKSLKISSVRREARLLATKVEQKFDTCHSTKEKFCCEQNDNKFGLTGSVSDATSDKDNQNVFQNNGAQVSHKHGKTEPADPLKNKEADEFDKNLLATKVEQKFDTCHSTKEKFCCEQKDNKLGASDSESDVISDRGSKFHVVKSIENNVKVCTIDEPLSPLKTADSEVEAQPNISLSINNNINNNLDNNYKEDKEIHKEKEESKKQPKLKYAEHVSMTEDEFNKLIAKYGKEQTIWMINKLNAYKGSKNKRYVSDYLAILNWVVSEYEKQNKNNGKINSRIHPGGTPEAPADYGNSTI